MAPSSSEGEGVSCYLIVNTNCDLMSEDAKNRTTWQSDPRLRYLLPVFGVLGLILLILVWAASCSGRDDGRGLKPARASRTPVANGASGEVVLLSFTDLNSAPETYHTQRLRVTGAKVMITAPACRLYTGPLFTWGLIAEDLQLYALGHEAVVKRLPDGLTMTVEGVWRQYNGPLGCGKEPADGQAWYLQVERIISPNPLPLVADSPFATIQVNMGAQVGIDTTPFVTPLPETAVTEQPRIGITPLPTNTPRGTASPGVLPTATTHSTTATATAFPGLTPSRTPRPGVTATRGTPVGGGTATTTATGTITTTATATPAATVSSVATQPSLATSTPYPGGGGGVTTPIPTSTPYPEN